MRNKCARRVLVLSLIAAALAGVAPSHAATFDDKFVVVTIDAQTENKTGGFPTRQLMAQLIDRITAAKPKSIILKFFLDSEGKEPDSTMLVTSLAKTRVILQATLNKSPPTTKLLDDRFYFKAAIAPHKPAVSGDEGWIPLKRFSDKSPKVCFADVATPGQVPMIEMFNGRPVESLYACALAEAYGNGTLLLTSHRATFGKQSLALDDAAEVRIALADVSLPTTLSALRILDGAVTSDAFTGKVVILAYTGSRSPTINVRGTPVLTHQVFLAQLRELVGLLK
ncbi:MAG: CHASE2 domain-containing protein [Betaproteobacteria bacterium]